MSLETLFKSLESIFETTDAKKKSDDPNLKQGQEFLYFEQQYKKLVEPDLALLEQTTSPNLGSIVEALEGANSTKNHNKAQTDAVSSIEEQFNKILAEYTSTYKIFSEELLHKNQSQKNVSSYFGKVATSDDGSYTYINDYGFTHKYSTDAWVNNNATCPTTMSYISDDEVAQMRSGPDMGVGQPCEIAGKNIQNAETKETAWIDVKGLKHIYSEAVWKAKESSCSIKPITVDNASYNAIPSGNNMTSTTVCDQLDVNPKIWEKLVDLNNKLMDLAAQLNVKMDDLVIEDSKLKAAVKKHKQQVNQHVNTLTTDRTALQNINQRMSTISGEARDSKLILTSNFYKYLVWIIVAIAIVSITVHNTTSDNQTMAANVVVIIFLVVLVYMIGHWAFQKY